jgi:rod shape-determining protein MreD
MRPALYVAMLGGGTLVQNSVAPLVQIAGVPPDIPLILTVLFAIRQGTERGCLTGFGLGLTQDLLGSGLVGVHALTKSMVGFFTGFFGGRFWIHLPLVQVPVLILMTIGEGLLRYALLRLFHFPAPIEELFLYAVLPQALYNGLIGAVTVLALTWFDARRSAH